MTLPNSYVWWPIFKMFKHYTDQTIDISDCVSSASQASSLWHQSLTDGIQGRVEQTEKCRDCAVRSRILPGSQACLWVSQRSPDFLVTGYLMAVHVGGSKWSLHLLWLFLLITWKSWEQPLRFCYFPGYMHLRRSLPSPRLLCGALNTHVKMPCTSECLSPGWSRHWV